MDAIATRTARNPRSNARDDVHDRFSCDIPHAYARASRARTRARLAAPFANGRIHHPSSGDTRESPIHPSIHPRRSCASAAKTRSSRTLLARTATDRRRCVVCLTLVVTTGVARARADRMIGPGRGVTNDEARLARSPRLGHSSGSIARRGLDAWSRSVDRSIVGGDGRRAGRMSEHTHTAGAIAATEVATWARVGAHYARARPRRCG